MTKHNLTLISSISLILLFGHSIAQEEPPLSLLLPKIDQEHFKLTPEGNIYTLKLTLLDGSSRNEVVEVKNHGTPEQFIAVLGTSKLLYPGATATIKYSADKQGYFVKYKYEKIPVKVVTLSAGGLKAAAG